MKKNSLAWLAPAALLVMGSLAALPACDIIDNPQPLKLTLTAGKRDTISLDSAEATHAVPALTQNVLIEDYTGQYCGNCPRAAHMADSMRLKYPGRVLVTEVHVTSYFAAPRLPHFPLDFRVADFSKPLPNTGSSDDINRLFDFDNRGLPQGAVNRAPFPAANNDPVATFSLWPGLVTNQLAIAPLVELRATPLFNRTSRLLRLKVATKYLSAMPGRSFNLGIIVTEDSVYGAQKDYRLNLALNPDQTMDRYLHRNVMRAALAGILGTPQVTAPTANQRFITYLGFKMPAASVWNDRHCSVIVYVTDGSTRQIVQVVQARLP